MDEATRKLISQRTRQAIAERKAAGTYHRRPFIPRATTDAILGLRRRGWSIRRIATLLDREGRPTARGGPWSYSSVRLILEREMRRPPVREAGGHSAGEASSQAE